MFWVFYLFNDYIVDLWSHLDNSQRRELCIHSCILIHSVYQAHLITHPLTNFVTNTLNVGLVQCLWGSWGSETSANVSSTHVSVCLLLCLMSPLITSYSLPDTHTDIINILSSVWSTGGRVKTWKRRWFILTDNCLYYFEFTTVRESALLQFNDWIIQYKYKTSVVFYCGHMCFQDKEPRGIIPLENLSIREVDDSKKPVSFLTLFHLLLSYLSYFVIRQSLWLWLRIFFSFCFYEVDQY